MIKKIGLVALAFVLVLGGCSCQKESETQTVAGTYEYVAWGTTYGAKVEVDVKDNKIEAIRVEPDSEARTNCSNVSGSGWTQDDVNNWVNGQEEFVNSLVGLTVEQVNSIEVTTSASGVPQTITGNDDYVTGATQSSGRIILAVQLALKELR